MRGVGAEIIKPPADHPALAADVCASVLQLGYDITPIHFVTAVVTEVQLSALLTRHPSPFICGPNSREKECSRVGGDDPTIFRSGHHPRIQR